MRRASGRSRANEAGSPSFGCLWGVVRGCVTLRMLYRRVRAVALQPRLVRLQVVALVDAAPARDVLGRAAGLTELDWRAHLAREAVLAMTITFPADLMQIGAAAQDVHGDKPKNKR